MLGLITGVGGFGKTAHTLDLVFFQDSEFKALDKYVEGVGFTEDGHKSCPHFTFPPLDQLKDPDYVPVSVVDGDDEDADKYKPWLPSHPEYSEFVKARATAKHSIELWFLWVTPGSVVVVDEVQRFFRPRASGSKVPLYISMLEYLRHFGCHILGISQAPRLVDLHYRSLVEKHIHLDKTWKGGKKYEWVTCKDIDSKADKKDAAVSAYSPPKHVFPLYKSSSLHLKVKHKFPLAIKVMIAAVPLFIFLVWYAIGFIRSHNKPVGLPDVVAAQPLQTGLGSGSSVPSAELQSIEDYLKSFAPIVPGRPETAPAYAPLRRVSVVPRVSACLASGDKCICYSQQGSRLREISQDRCSQILQTGQDFDPYNAQEAAVAPAPSFQAGPASSATSRPVAPSLRSAMPDLKMGGG